MHEQDRAICEALADRALLEQSIPQKGPGCRPVTDLREVARSNGRSSITLHDIE